MSEDELLVLLFFFFFYQIHQIEGVTEEVFRDKRPLRKKYRNNRAQKAVMITSGFKLRSQAEIVSAQRMLYNTIIKGSFYKKYTRPEIY